MKKVRKNRRSGFSLLELLAVVTILGIIAVVVIPRIAVSSSTAKDNALLQSVSEINSAIERYYFDKGSWPTDLDDIFGDTTYFPEGDPKNPKTGSVGTAGFSYNATTHRAAGA